MPQETTESAARGEPVVVGERQREQPFDLCAKRIIARGLESPSEELNDVHNLWS